jgi:hypothetical protein
MYDHDDFYKHIAEMLLFEPEKFNYNYKLGGLDIKGIADSDYFFS